MHAYENASRAAATKHVPLYVVPGSNMWFERLIVAAAIVEAVGNLDLRYLDIDAAKKRDIATARAELAHEK